MLGGARDEAIVKRTAYLLQATQKCSLNVYNPYSNGRAQYTPDLEAARLSTMGMWPAGFPDSVWNNLTPAAFGPLIRKGTAKGRRGVIRQIRRSKTQVTEILPPRMSEAIRKATSGGQAPVAAIPGSIAGLHSIQKGNTRTVLNHKHRQWQDSEKGREYANAKASLYPTDGGSGRDHSPGPAKKRSRPAATPKPALKTKQKFKGKAKVTIA